MTNSVLGAADSWPADQREMALQGLRARHEPELLRFALRLTRDPGLAEDVVQEALLRAWRDPNLTNREENVSRAWLFTVTRHLIVDRWRSAAFRREVTGLPVGNELSSGDATGEVLDRWLIADALRCMSPPHRAVVCAAYYEQLSVAEISRRLRIPEGTVKSRLHYGLRSLRLILQEKGVTRP